MKWSQQHHCRHPAEFSPTNHLHHTPVVSPALLARDVGKGEICLETVGGVRRVIYFSICHGNFPPLLTDWLLPPFVFFFRYGAEFRIWGKLTGFGVLLRRAFQYFFLFVLYVLPNFWWCEVIATSGSAGFWGIHTHEHSCDMSLEANVCTSSGRTSFSVGNGLAPVWRSWFIFAA